MRLRREGRDTLSPFPGNATVWPTLGRRLRDKKRPRRKHRRVTRSPGRNLRTGNASMICHEYSLKTAVRNRLQVWKDRKHKTNAPLVITRAIMRNVRPPVSSSLHRSQARSAL